MKKLKVLVPILNYYPLTGGAELFTKRVAEELSIKGVETLVITRRVEGYPDEEIAGGVRIKRVGPSHKNIGSVTIWDGIKMVWFLFFSTWKTLKNERFDLLHSNGFTGALMCYILKLLKRIPYISTLQSGDWDLYYKIWSTGPMNFLKKISYGGAGVVHAVSNHVGECFSKMGIANEKISVIPNGVDVEMFAKASGSAVRRKYGIKDNEVVLSYVGRVLPVHGGDLFLEACGRLAKKGLAFRVMIVGDGLQRPELEKQCEDLGIKDRVIFTGNVVYADIAEYFAACDIFCRPSRAEGFGMVYLEAMASGCVSVGTDVGGIPDIITNTVNGIMTPSEDVDSLERVLEKLIKNPDARNKLIESGKQRASTQDWSVIAERIRDNYLAVVGGCGCIDCKCGDNCKCSADSECNPLAKSIKNKKTVFAAGIYPPDIGGPATYVKSLATDLSSRGLDAEVVCYSDSLSIDDGNIKVRRVLRGSGRFGRYKRAVADAINGADTLYIQSPLSSGWPILSLLKKFKGRKIIKIVGDPVWEGYRGRGGLIGIDDFQTGFHGVRTFIERIMLKSVMFKIDTVVVPSKYLGSICEGWGVPYSKIKVIYNAAHEVKLDQNIEKKDYVFSCGRIVNWKGFDELIDLWKTWPDAPILKIAGDGPELNRLKNRVSEEKLSEKIIFLGKLEKPDIMKSLQEAKAFVLNTGYEGFSHVLLEAIACKCPPITTKVCGNPELVKDEVNGFLYELGDMNKLKNLIERVYRGVDLDFEGSLEEFSLERMKRETDKLLEI
jgi:glycosyltransferase involved in cell wall biosynthesis